MIYVIVFRNSVKKDLRKIPDHIVERIKNALAALKENPYPMYSAKLHGYQHLYRIRIGSYRILYEVATEIRIITVTYIRHRKEVYRAL